MRKTGVALFAVVLMTEKGEKQESQRMVDGFHLTLHEKLARTYQMMDALTANALRIQMALVKRRPIRP